MGATRSIVAVRVISQIVEINAVPVKPVPIRMVVQSPPPTDMRSR